MRDIAAPIDYHKKDEHEEPKGHSHGFWWFVVRVVLLFLISALITLGFLAVKAGTTFSVVSEELKEFLGIDTAKLPVGDPREQDRIDILLLGLRGEGDPNGGLLTDTMIVVSIDTKHGNVAFISIPRDTYVKVPVVEEMTKINAAFALGESYQESGGGLVLSRLASQEVLGINIDHVVAVDFKAFVDTIDLLGGIDVDVARPLRESEQWQGLDFYIPAGKQHMDGETALYYARARFMSSDFDRARRQQEILIALRDKALSLGFLANPAKLSGLLDILGKHVRVDISTDDVRSLRKDIKLIANEEPKRLVIDTTELMYATSFNGSYILLPKGDTFETIRTRARNIFETDTRAELSSGERGIVVGDL